MQKTFPQTGEGFYFVLNIQTRLAVVDIDAFTHVAGGKHTATARVKAVNTARTVAVEVDNHPAGAVVAVVIPTAFGIATVAAAFNHRATVAVVDTVVTVTRAAIRLFNPEVPIPQDETQMISTNGVSTWSLDAIYMQEVCPMGD